MTGCPPRIRAKMVLASLIKLLTYEPTQDSEIVEIVGDDGR